MRGRCPIFAALATSIAALASCAPTPAPDDLGAATTDAATDLGRPADARDAGPDDAPLDRPPAPDAGASPDAPRDAGAPLDADAPLDGWTCTMLAPTSCPDPVPRYASVSPIIEARCVPCHNGVPNGPWSLIGYDHVADWQGIIRDQLAQCTMPPPDAGSRLSDAERLAILTWLRCGLPR